MKYKVQLLNYDSEWVDYCVATSQYYAEQAVHDLRQNHNFEKFQVQIVMQ